MRLLWWLILIAVCYWLLKPKSPRPAHSAHPHPAGKNGFGEKMVQCAHCEMFVPASESVSGPGGHAFCCDEHRLRASN